jgi:hypothetical protein
LKISFIGQAKGISKFVREQALPASEAQLEELRVTVIGGLGAAADLPSFLDSVRTLGAAGLNAL